MLGFSIQSPAFLGRTTRSSPNDIIGNCNSLDSFLYMLKDNGIASIEIRILPRDADEMAYREGIQRIWDAGLTLTVHGHVEGKMAGVRFEDIYPSMKYILRNFDRYQDQVTMAIHAYDAQSGSEDELFHRTVELFREWTSMAEAEHLPLRFALENNRKKKSKVDPGDTTLGVLRMVQEIGSPLMGITWDMGHFYSDMLGRQGHKDLAELPLLTLPEPEFLTRVIHTHIHGIGDSGTHHPLTEILSLPLEHYVNALQEAGYDGIYNLELTMDKFGKELSIPDHIAASVQRLKTTVS